MMLIKFTHYILQYLHCTVFSVHVQFCIVHTEPLKPLVLHTFVIITLQYNTI